MATHPLGGYRGVVINPPCFPPAAAVRLASRLLDAHTQAQIADAITVLIDVLDLIGGDAEAEESPGEDSFMPRLAAGPGCPVADGAGDQSWTEWHSRSAQRRRSNAPEFAIGSEDDEQDDPAGQCDEDGINTGIGYALDSGAGCTISDPGGEQPSF